MNFCVFPDRGLAASHSSKDPPYSFLGLLTICISPLNSVRWCCRGRAKRENVHLHRKHTDTSTASQLITWGCPYETFASFQSFTSNPNVSCEILRVWRCRRMLPEDSQLSLQCYLHRHTGFIQLYMSVWVCWKWNFLWRYKRERQTWKTLNIIMTFFVGLVIPLRVE